MIQRLGLAQAIQHDPELVILDEPMSGLDPIGRREVRDLILTQRASGRTVFFSSHILQDAEMVCDRVAIVFKGKLVALGKLDDLVLAGGEVDRGLGPWRPPGRRCRERSAIDPRRDDARQGRRRPLADGAPDGSAGSGAEVVSVWPRRESLEDLFLREIGRAKAEERAS